MERLKELFETQQKHLNYFFEQVDFEKVFQIFQMIVSCKGSLIWTGVGKSGIIAYKTAMTFLSTGAKSWYLSSGDALHGDIGMVSPGDLCFLLSRSGETKELLQLLSHLQERGAKTIAVVSRESSQLSKKADFFISLPVEKEICPFNLVPTTSTSVQAIFGDILAVACMMERKMSLSEFSKNHPAGTIGKKLTVFVEELMLTGKNIPFCHREATVKDVLPELSSKCCGALFVVDSNKKLLGIFTDGDLRRLIESRQENFLTQKMEDVMTKNPKWTTSKTLALDALSLMEDSKKVLVLPVLDERALTVVGAIRLHDLAQSGIQ